MRENSSSPEPVTVKSVPRDAPASISSPSVCAWRSANGFSGIRAMEASNIWLSSFIAYRLVRAAAERLPRSSTIPGSLNANPSEMKMSVFGASIARSPRNRSRSACIV